MSDPRHGDGSFTPPSQGPFASSDPAAPTGADAARPSGAPSTPADPASPSTPSSGPGHPGAAGVGGPGVGGPGVGSPNPSPGPAADPTPATGAGSTPAGPSAGQVPGPGGPAVDPAGAAASPAGPAAGSPAPTPNPGAGVGGPGVGGPGVTPPAGGTPAAPPAAGPQAPAAPSSPAGASPGAGDVGTSLPTQAGANLERNAQAAASQAASQAAVTAANSVAPGAGTAMKATGLDKAVGKQAEKAVAEGFKRVTQASSVMAAVIFLLVASIIGATTLIYAATRGDEFPLPGDPAAMEIDEPTSELFDAYENHEKVTDVGADDLQPPGWAEVVYQAQERTKSDQFGIPWTVLAGLARTQTDFARRSPYDNIDRDPTRHPRFGAPPGATGSSGISTGASGYDGPVLLIGDSLVSSVAASVASTVPNQLQTASADLAGAASALPARGDAPDVVVAAFTVPTDGRSQSRIADQMRAVMNRVGKGHTVYWVNGYHPTRPGYTSDFNSALGAVKSDYDNLRVLDWASAARSNSRLTKSDGSLTAAGKSRLNKLIADAVKNASAGGSWVLPLPPGYRMSAYFGQAGSAWSSGYHTGQDLAAPVGTKIFAVSDGVVASAGTAGAYGNRVVIQHAGGVQTWYAHMERFTVKQGQRVTAGDQIGAIGMTGNTFGPHLHIEARTGNGATAVDPLKYIPGVRASAAVLALLHPDGLPDGTGAHPDHDDAAPESLPEQLDGLYEDEDPHTGAAETGVLAGEDDCAVATAATAIGGGKNQAAGPFLLRPSHLAAMEADDLDPQNPCDQAYYVARELSADGDQLILDSDFDDWETSDEEAKALWEEVINSSDLFADPTNGKTDCAITTGVTASNAPFMIRSTFECEATLVPSLEVAVDADRGSKVSFSTLTGDEATDQLATEAIIVAANGGGLAHPDQCNPNARYAGVFPLTAAEARRIGAADRCDPATVIEAVAKAVVAAETTPVDSRPKGQGRYAPMLGGWAKFSAAVGDRPGQFASQGPAQVWEPSTACVDAISATLTDVVTSRGAGLDPLVEGELDAAAAGKIRAWLNSAADPRRNACRGATDSDYYSQLSVIAEGLAEEQAADSVRGNTPTSEDAGALAERYLLLGRYAQVAAQASGGNDKARFGVDPMVSRLAPVAKTINPAPDLGYDSVGLQEYPIAAASVELAVGYGGIRPDWDTASIDVLDANSLTSAGAFSAGGDAAAVIAAAKSQVGVPYSWGGGGPGGPSTGFCDGVNGYLNGQCSATSTKGFDCSGLMEYAFSKAGYSIGGTSNAQKTAGKPVAGLDDALPGDLLFWGSPTTYHVALYLGNGKMIEAPRTGLNVRIASVTPGVSYIRRVIPENSGGSWDVASGPGVDALAARLPANGKQYAGLFVAAGRKHNLDPALLAGVAMQESGFSPDVVRCTRTSSAGAQGMMQFMPATAAGMGVRPCDPESSVYGAGRYLRQLTNQFGDPRKALAAYNFGPGNVSSGAPWPEETRNYVQSVPQHCRTFGGCGAA